MQWGKQFLTKSSQLRRQQSATSTKVNPPFWGGCCQNCQMDLLSSWCWMMEWFSSGLSREASARWNCAHPLLQLWRNFPVCRTAKNSSGQIVIRDFHLKGWGVGRYDWWSGGWEEFARQAFRHLWYSRILLKLKEFQSPLNLFLENILYRQINMARRSCVTLCLPCHLQVTQVTQVIPNLPRIVMSVTKDYLFTVTHSLIEKVTFWAVLCS